MKNGIIRELMKRLSQAPKIVAEEYIDTLMGEDKIDAIRLVKALGIKTKYYVTEKDEENED